jgi:hypothetical protein
MAQRRASRPTSALIGALVGGTTGLLSGALEIDWIDPGPPDLSMEMLIAMCVAGGLGWIAGAAFGWIGGRDRPTPSRTTRRMLLAIAVGFTWFGIVSIHQTQHGSFGPMIDEVSRPLRDRLVLSIAVDTALAAATLLTLAYVPARRRRGEDGRPVVALPPDRRSPCRPNNTPSD